MTDPIADMLTRIRNAASVGIDTVVVPHSKLKEELATILKKEGYVAEVNVDGDKIKSITLTLKYDAFGPVVSGLKRLSKPGCRLYVSAREIPVYLRGLGTSVVSTSRGLMTGKEAKMNNVGGELLCLVW